MKIYIFGKKGCGKCESAENKIKNIFKLDYRKVDMEEVNPPPKDWRDINMRGAMFLYTDTETLPIIGIDRGNGVEVFDYPQAMKLLKKITQ